MANSRQNRSQNGHLNVNNVNKPVHEIAFDFDHNCARCGSARIALYVSRRKAVLDTCTCKQDTLKQAINTILTALETHIMEPRYEQARAELRDYIAEFGDDG